MHKSSTVYKQKQSKIVLNKYVGGFDVRQQQENDFIIGVNITIDYGLVFQPELNDLMMDLLLTMYRHTAFHFTRC